MNQVNLKASKRVRTGKQLCKKVRKEGKIPGVIYGKGFENLLINVDAKDFQKTISTFAGTRVIINLDIEGEKEPVTTVVTEIQKDVYKKKFHHVDFHKISLNEKIQTNVPVNLIGEAIGVKSGGVMDHLIRLIPVLGLPLDIPEKIEYNITHMNENDRVTVADIDMPDTVEVLIDKEEAIAIVHPPRVAKVGGEGAEAQAAEPAAV